MMSEVSRGLGSQTWTIRIPDDKRVSLIRQTMPTAEAPAQLLRQALQRPLGLDAAFHTAVMPGDTATIVVDESLPQLGELLTALLGELRDAGIESKSVTLLVPPPSTAQPWLDDLPEAFGDVTVEVHDPDDPKKVAYIASTKSERRVYLNRTLVDADLAVVLGSRRYDPALDNRCGGAELQLFPALSNRATLEDFAKLTTTDDGIETMLAEAKTATWFLGLPFFVQVIEGEADTIAEVVAGLPSSTEQGIARQEAHWSWNSPMAAELVIVTVNGQADRLAFRDLATAVGTGRELVTATGRVVLLTNAAVPLDVAAQRIRDAETAAEASASLAAAHGDGDWLSALEWCLAATQVPLSVASAWPEETVDELFATPLLRVEELQRLIDRAASVVIIPDAHKAAVSLQTVGDQ